MRQRASAWLRASGRGRSLSERRIRKSASCPAVRSFSVRSRSDVAKHRSHTFLREARGRSVPHRAHRSKSRRSGASGAIPDVANGSGSLVATSTGEPGACPVRRRPSLRRVSVRGVCAGMPASRANTLAKSSAAGAARRRQIGSVSARAWVRGARRRQFPCRVSWKSLDLNVLVLRNPRTQASTSGLMASMRHRRTGLLVGMEHAETRI